MKTIYKGQDDLYYNIKITDTESNTALYPDDLADFRIRVFTKNQENYAEYTVENIYDDVLYINAQDIEHLEDGALKMQFIIAFNNDCYVDSEQDYTSVRNTGFLLKTQR